MLLNALFVFPDTSVWDHFFPCVKNHCPQSQSAQVPAQCPALLRPSFSFFPCGKLPCMVSSSLSYVSSCTALTCYFTDSSAHLYLLIESRNTHLSYKLCVTYPACTSLTLLHNAWCISNHSGWLIDTYRISAVLIRLKSLSVTLLVDSTFWQYPNPQRRCLNPPLGVGLVGGSLQRHKIFQSIPAQFQTVPFDKGHWAGQRLYSL